MNPRAYKTVKIKDGTDEVEMLTATQAKETSDNVVRSNLSKSAQTALRLVDSASKLGLRKTYIVWGEDCPFEDNKEVGQALKDRGFTVVYEDKRSCVPVSEPWRLRVEW